MSRKQVVLIEWIILLTVLAGVVIGGVFLLVTRVLSRRQSETGGQTEVSTEAQTQIASETERMPEMVFETETEYDPVHVYTMSFAGDCTIGSLLEWQGTQPGDFQSVVGTDYRYPFSGVRSIFEADDLTVVNLEGTFTTATAAVEKPYRFKADPSYVQVLKEGSVEAVSASNNHSGDFFEAGFQDTIAALDSVGIWNAHAGSPLIKDLEGGMKLGIVSYNTVENYSGLEVWRSEILADIQACQSAGCDLIIGFMHWGTVEYLTAPEDWEVALAHDMADWGCDLIVGGHAHILQHMEYYNGVPIFYSMGNFCYGGHTNPSDKDSVIVQAEFTWNNDTEEAVRSGLKVIPCLVSSRTDVNNYCPTPCEEGGSDYQRIISRLEWAG